MTRSKYRNQPVTEDGHRFDSKAEHRRYLELKLLVAAKEISRLDVHPRFEIEVKGYFICHYEADFAYFDEREQQRIVEDVKGMRTDVYRLKAKLMRACHGITVREVPARGRKAA